MALSVIPIPIGLGFAVKWTPVFFNQSHKTMSGASIDIGLSAFPLHNFELTYQFLRDKPPVGLSEFQTALAFFMFQLGSLGRFLYFNPDDNTKILQVVGTGDGSTTTFTIGRTFGAFQNEPVGSVDVSGSFNLNVYVNHVLVSSFPASAALIGGIPGAQTLTLASAPPAGQQVQMDFTYYYYCKYMEDALTFEKFFDKIWTAQSVKFQSCRAGA
jgi:hypothetical protein